MIAFFLIKPFISSTLKKSCSMGDRGDLNPQHSPPQGDALPVELRPPVSIL